MATSNYTNHLYAMMPTVDPNGQGVALIVLRSGRWKIKGLKILTNGNTNFTVARSVFEKLIDDKRIEFVEVIPNEQLDNFKQTYLRNK
jgi:hypothetical protein